MLSSGREESFKIVARKTRKKRWLSSGKWS